MTLTPHDNEFFAEEIPITITPLFTQDKLVLAFKTYGPFIARKPLDVPLWIAIYLRNRKQCQISVPAYYTPEFLDDKIRTEKEDVLQFQVLPFLFFEVFQILSNKLFN